MQVVKDSNYLLKEKKLLLILIAKYQLFTSVWFHDFNSINVKSDLGKILDDTWADV